MLAFSFALIAFTLIAFTLVTFALVTFALVTLFLVAFALIALALVLFALIVRAMTRLFFATVEIWFACCWQVCERNSGPYARGIACSVVAWWRRTIAWPPRWSFGRYSCRSVAHLHRWHGFILAVIHFHLNGLFPVLLSFLC